MGKTAASLLIGLMVILVACGEESEPTPCDEVEGTCLYVQWDGENCDYTGPSEINAGPVTFIFQNETEENAHANLVRLDEGKTVQDIVYYIEEEDHAHAPSWVTHTGAYRFALPGESYTWNGDVEPGLHTLGCLPVGADYFGGEVTVVE